MRTTVERVTIVAPAPPSRPRLALAATRADQAVLDGGWWPRSWDPVAELPGLLLALADRYGPIRQVMISGTAWDSRFRRLAVGAGVVRMGWYTTMDRAVLIATTDRGDQIDLLVVPPETAAAAAEEAMAAAVDPTNVLRAPAILAATAGSHRGADSDAVRDDEAGHLVSDRRRRANGHRVAVAG